MPPKEWTHYLPDGFTLRVGRQTVGGKMTGFSVALVYEGECIVRYDTAHGFAHRDILGRKSGLIEKQTCETLSTREAFQYAIHDLKTNYRQHLAFYVAH
jgi:hypothetical protein